MSDVQPLPGILICGGIPNSGQTQPIDLQPAPRNVMAFCDVLSLAAGATVQLTLQMAVSDSGWVNVVSLPSQNATGVQQANAQVPAGVTNKTRLAWTVTGNGGAIAAFAAAVG